jgi:hypothetical protein
MDCSAVHVAAFIDSNCVYLCLIISSFIHSIIPLSLFIYYLCIYDVPITLSLAQNFTSPNITVSVQSISIIVQNFRPTQLSLYCNTATCFGPHTGSSSGCQMKTYLIKVHTHTKSLVSFLRDIMNSDKNCFDFATHFNRKA